MQALVVADKVLQPTSLNDFENVQKVFKACSDPNLVIPCDFPTEHFIHAGCYVRNVFLKQNTILVGAKIKLDTVLIVQGDIFLNMNEGIQRFKGYNIIRALHPRQQYIYANKDSNLTMLYATKADSPYDAECEFTDDTEQLLTRKTK